MGWVTQRFALPPPIGGLSWSTSIRTVNWTTSKMTMSSNLRTKITVQNFEPDGLSLGLRKILRWSDDWNNPKMIDNKWHYFTKLNILNVQFCHKVTIILRCFFFKNRPPEPVAKQVKVLHSTWRIKRTKSSFVTIRCSLANKWQSKSLTNSQHWRLGENLSHDHVTIPTVSDLCVCIHKLHACNH